MELPPGRGRTAWPPRLTNRRTASSISPNRVRRIARSHSTRHDSLFDESCRGQCLARSQSRRVSRRLLMSDPPTTPTIVCDHCSAPGNSKPAVRPAARKRRWRRSTTDPLAGSCRLPAAPRRTHRGMGRCGMVLSRARFAGREDSLRWPSASRSSTRCRCSGTASRRSWPPTDMRSTRLTIWWRGRRGAVPPWCC